MGDIVMDLKETAKVICSNIEYRRGIKFYLSSDYYSKKYCKGELSMWQFGDMLTNAGCGAIVEMLNNISFLFEDKKDKVSLKDVKDVLDLVRITLLDKAQGRNL